MYNGWLCLSDSRVVVSGNGLLDKHQEEWLRSNYSLASRQSPPKLSLSQHISEQAMPSPVFEISHSSKALLLMHTVQWIEEHLMDEEDYYGMEV